MSARLAKDVKVERRKARPIDAIRECAALAVVEQPPALVGPDAAQVGHDGDCRPSSNEIDRLCASLAAVSADDHPRTAKLLAASTRKVAQKVIEEAGEVALEAVKHNSRAIVGESADLLYHLAVLWQRAGIRPADVWAEMRRRADSLGLAEKPPKSASQAMIRSG
jgi:phosphoribosyl-ATP pyrophosphohydrolase